MWKIEKLSFSGKKSKLLTESHGLEKEWNNTMYFDRKKLSREKSKEKESQKKPTKTQEHYVHTAVSFVSLSVYSKIDI